MSLAPPRDPLPADPYPIGYRFTIRRKNHHRDCVVVDHHTTYNFAGEAVRFRYVTEHTFMGQPVRDSDVTHTTIARASS